MLIQYSFFLGCVDVNVQTTNKPPRALNKIQCLCGMAGEVLTCSGMVHMVYRNNKISITDVELFGVGKMVKSS